MAVNEEATKGREQMAKGKKQRRHGDVVDTFIPRKPSRGGKKFGFVHSGKKIDAERVIERLNGFTLYGFRLSVKMARFEAKSRGGGYTKEVTRLCSQEKVCPAYRKKGVHVLDPGHWDKPNGKRYRRGTIENSEL
ncbi:hypothetical protein V6N13_085475 [Hibiscus sabdariffa]